ncbi:MAG: hypothetical protein ACOH10_07745 [Rhodoglobus sp.]
MTTYLAPPRAVDGRYADKPEVGLARRLTEQARDLLGYEEQTEETPAEPLDIEAMLAKQAEHPLATRPLLGMESKGSTVGAIAGIVKDAIGFVSFDPSAHPRDYRGRFLATGDDVNLPDGRTGTIETLNADGSMSVRTDGGIAPAMANEVSRIGDVGGISVSLPDGRTGNADHTDATGSIMVRLADNTEVAATAADLTPAVSGPEPGNVLYGIDGRVIVQGAGVRDDAGHIGVATAVTPEKVTVDFGGDTRTMRHDTLRPTAGTADSPFPSPLDERLVNSKPDRTLADPTKTVPLADLLPEARYQAYSQVPFLAELHERMGVEDPLSVDVGDYLASRDAVFDAQPLVSIPLDHVVVTQPNVNRERVTQIAVDPSTGGTKPVHFVRYNGESYVMNGHHRVAGDIINGDATAMGRVLNLDLARANDPTIDPFAATGADAVGLPTGIGSGAVVLIGNGHLAYITDAADSGRMRAWDDDTRTWTSLALSDIGSVRVANTSPDKGETETLIRARAKEAGLSRVPKPAVVGADLPTGSVRPRGALAPVDGLDSLESLGDGAVPRAGFEALMFPETGPSPLNPDSPLPPDVQRRGAAHRRAVDAIAPAMGDLPEDLVAELTAMPVDAEYALTSIGGVIKVTEQNRVRLAEVATAIMPGDDPRVAAYRRRELTSHYITLWSTTAGDSQPRAIAMQAVARELFGLENDAKSLAFNPIVDADIPPIVAHEGAAMRAYLSGSYAATQAHLTAAGVDSIVAYRGMSWRHGDEPDWASGPQTDQLLRPLSSWSADPTHAAEFADNYGDGGTGVVLAATIPRDRILSIPSTGPGAFGESELLVLAGPGITTVVNPINAPQTGPGIDETPSSATWHSPGVPLADMPSRDDMEVPVHGTDTFAWQQWADFYLSGLPSTQGEDFKNTDGLSDIKATTHHLVAEDWRHEAKAKVVTDLVKEMALVPDDVIFKGAGGQWDGRVEVGGGLDVLFEGDSRLYPVPTRAGIFKGEPGRIVPIREDQNRDPLFAPYGPLANPDLWDIVPVTDPRVVAFRRGEVINALVHQWAQTSNDGSPVSHAIQEIAAENFALTDTAEWNMDLAARMGGHDDLRPLIDHIKTVRGPVITAFLQAQYDLTQRRYADAGITEVTVYRGMGWSGGSVSSDFVDTPEWATIDGVATIPIRPLSSWSVDRDTADQFARSNGQGVTGQVNVVVGTTVPVERILSTPRSGFGALNEWEVVVIGGQLDVTVRTNVIPLLTDEEANATPAGTLDRTEDFQTAVRMASTEERRKQLMARAADRGGWNGLIPQEWRPKNTGLSEDGLTFDGTKDEDSQEAKVARYTRGALLTLKDIGNARDLYDAIAAEEYGDVYGIVSYGSSYQHAQRRVDLMALIGKYHLPGLNLPPDWANAT